MHTPVSWGNHIHRIKTLDKTDNSLSMHWKQILKAETLIILYDTLEHYQIRNIPGATSTVKEG